MVWAKWSVGFVLLLLFLTVQAGLLLYQQHLGNEWQRLSIQNQQVGLEAQKQVNAFKEEIVSTNYILADRKREAQLILLSAQLDLLYNSTSQVHIDIQEAISSLNTIFYLLSLILTIGVGWSIYVITPQRP
jgi:hypothetical protein